MSHPLVLHRPSGVDRARDAPASTCGCRRGRARRGPAWGHFPYHRLIDTSASRTPRPVTLWWLQETIVGLDTIPVRGRRAAAAIGWSSSPSRRVTRSSCLRSSCSGCVSRPKRIERFDHGFPKASVGALYQGITAREARTGRRRVGRDADVAFVFSGKDPTHHPDTLWGERVLQPQHRPGVRPSPAVDGSLPETKVTQRADGVLLDHGQPVRHTYVLSERKRAARRHRRCSGRAEGNWR